MRMAAITHVKIYGERNSGTTVLGTSIRKNFDIKFWKKGKKLERKELTRRTSRHLFGHRKRVARENAIDEIARETMVKSFGWKHCAPPIELIKNDPRSEKTLFLVITKHPYFWLSSLHRHPYHRLGKGKPPKSFSTFLREPWITLGRDNLGSVTLPSPADLYRLKLEHYRTLLSEAPHTLHIRYEDLLADYSGTLDTIADALDVPTGKWARPEKSVKSSSQTFSDYAKTYKLEKAGQKLSERDRDYIARSIPDDLAAVFGYDLRMTAETTDKPAGSLQNA